ncbi:methyltransferase-like protein 27 [Physella acuta]|uniref:methyltransferase-like protein 27 n=1 Tax=Physella acuta TaxID=109671 RepID=UPI0027DC6BFE|nr:methyltransferase-like protein 27 [Physella acuta]
MQHETNQTTDREKAYTRQEMYDMYSEWAKDAKYEKEVTENNYRGPLITSEAMVQFYPDEEVRKNLYILDVAAGTGMVGSLLKCKGFGKIDALDPNESMLNLAKSKSIYNRTFLIFLGEESTKAKLDRYDAVVVSGGFANGHIPCSGLDALISLTKPGGHVFIAMLEADLTGVEEYKDRLEPHMKELEVEGQWVAVSRTVTPNYYKGDPGVVFIFKVKR